MNSNSTSPEWTLKFHTHIDTQLLNILSNKFWNVTCSVLSVWFCQIPLIQYRNLCMDNLTIKLPHKLHQIFSCQAAAQIHTHTQTEILTQAPSATLAINKQQIFYANFQFNTTLNAHWEGKCVGVCICICVWVWISGLCIWSIRKHSIYTHTETHVHSSVCVFLQHTCGLNGITWSVAKSILWSFS